jgi:hypothetical protein
MEGGRLTGKLLEDFGLVPQLFFALTYTVAVVAVPTLMLAFVRF